MTRPTRRTTSARSRIDHFVGPRDEEIAYLNRETRKLEQAIKNLHEERSELLQRLNALSSPVASLPFETLSAIFEFACSPHDFQDQMKPLAQDRLNFLESDDAESTNLKENGRFQLVIGAVSSQWRSVVQASPWLWTSIDLDVSPTNSEHRAAFLRLCLANSRWIPLSLSLYYINEFDSGAPLLIHESVDSLIVKSLSRVRGLRLINPPRKWLTHIPSLSRITDCFITNPDSLGMGVVLPQIAPLHRFAIELSPNTSMTTIQLPWSKITSLVLSRMRFERTVQMLLKCPNLVEFRCYNPERPSLGSAVTLTRPVILQHLEFLELSTNETWEWSNALLQHLHVPALKQLEWTAHGHIQANIQAFVNRLPPTLSTVKLHDNCTPLSHFPLTSNVEHVTLTDCRAGSLTAFLTHLQKLVSRGRGRRRLMNFPKLKTLFLEGHVSYDHGRLYGTFPSEYSDLLFNMLDRRSTSGVSFCLETETPIRNWPPETKRRLKELVTNGFDLRIIENSIEVSWLR